MEFNQSFCDKLEIFIIAGVASSFSMNTICFKLHLLDPDSIQNASAPLFDLLNAYWIAHTIVCL